MYSRIKTNIMYSRIKTNIMYLRIKTKKFPPHSPSVFLLKYITHKDMVPSN
jgi:hypothetical protein